jgi:hypothetical protein
MLLLGEQSFPLLTANYEPVDTLRSELRSGIGGWRFHAKCLMSSVTMISHASRRDL